MPRPASAALGNEIGGKASARGAPSRSGSLSLAADEGRRLRTGCVSQPGHLQHLKEAGPDDTVRFKQMTVARARARPRPRPTRGAQSIDTASSGSQRRSSITQQEGSTERFRRQRSAVTGTKRLRGHRHDCAVVRYLRAPDRVSVKPHASPVLHAINYLLGELDGLSCSDCVSTAACELSVADRGSGSDRLLDRRCGIGATRSSGRDRNRYLAGHFEVPVGGRQIALLGDAELDEGAVWEANCDPSGREARRGGVDHRPQPSDPRPRGPEIAVGPFDVDVRCRRLANDLR